jgi:hypothetical protein
VAVVRVDVRVRLRVVLLRGIELGDLLRDGGEQSEGERREAQQPENEEKGEESELADAPPFGAPG